MKTTDFTPEVLRPFDVRHVPYVVPEAGVFDSPLVCVFMNGQWASHVDGVLERLLFRDAWVGEDADVQRAIGEVRRLLAALGAGDACIGTGGCVEYAPDATAVSWAPTDPYVTPDLLPNGYALPPWFISDGEVYTDITRLPLAFPPLLPPDGYPRFRYNFIVGPSGLATVEIHLKRIFQGGLALISLDDNVSSVDFIDLETASVLDLATINAILGTILDGGLVRDHVYERVVTGAGLHHIDVTFIPKVTADTLLGFGGGLKKIVLCGEDSIGTMPAPEFRLNNGRLEWRTADGAVWIDLGNVTGPQGAQGSSGPAGPQGAQGAPGPQGAPGECLCDDDIPTPEDNSRCNVAYGLATRAINDMAAAWQDIIAYPDVMPLVWVPTNWALAYSTTVPWLGVSSFPAMLQWAISRVGLIADDNTLNTRLLELGASANVNLIARAFYLKMPDPSIQLTAAKVVEIADWLYTLADPGDIFKAFADWIKAVPLMRLQYLQLEASVFEQEANCGSVVPPAIIGFPFETFEVSESYGTVQVAVTLVLEAGFQTEEEITATVVLDEGGTAALNSDFTMTTPYIVTFPPGSQSGAVQYVPIGITNDALYEGNETIKLRVFSVTGNASIAAGNGQSDRTTITIVSDDAQIVPTVEFASTTSMIGEAGGNIAVAVRLGSTTGATQDPVTVQVTVTGGTAGAGDFTLNTTQVTFPAGSTDGATQDVSVSILNDTIAETNETIVLTLSSPSGGTLGAQVSHTVTVTDDEWCYEFDFTVSNGGWATSGRGAYGADGFTSTAGAGANIGTGINISRNFSQSTITNVTMTYNLTAVGGVGAFNPRTVVILRNSGTQTFRNDIENLTNGDGKQHTVNPNVNATTLELYLIIDQAEPFAGSGRIYRVRVRGLGTNPFGNSNCP